MCAGVAYNLGVFPTEIEAAYAYDRAARQLHSEHAVTNFSPEGTETQSITLRRALVEHYNRDTPKEPYSPGSDSTSVSNDYCNTISSTTTTMLHHNKLNARPIDQNMRQKHIMSYPDARNNGLTSGTTMFPAPPRHPASVMHQSSSYTTSLTEPIPRRWKRLWRESSTGLLTGDTAHLQEYIVQLQNQLQAIEHTVLDGRVSNNEVNDEYVSLTIRLDDAIAYHKDVTTSGAQIATSAALVP